MDVSTSSFGTPGERDEDGYHGYYTLGTQYLFIEGNEYLVALEFAAQPEEIVFVARRRQGAEVPLSISEPDAFLQAVIKYLKELRSIKRIKTLVGMAVELALAE